MFILTFLNYIQSKKYFHTILMVRKVLSLYKSGTRLTKQSFRDEDEQDLSEIEDQENENDESCEDPYERVGKICKYFLEKKAFTDSDGQKKYQTHIGMS